MKRDLIKLITSILKDWRDGSDIKIDGCPSRGPGFNSKHSHGGSQLSLTAVLWALVPSSGFCRYQTSRGFTDMKAGKTLMNIK